jgi:hypothetical protein
MNQKERLDKVDMLQLHIANMNRIIREFEAQKLELLKGCRHKDGGGRSAVDEDDHKCWICGKEVV